ncbi:protease inhibitor Inh/omp19 family protein [Mesorhizobium sp. ANAO-SY3R2]|uniref:protease inhibitor Inh/omp19 family protein n=1 Tax=Mesorhizobium sp. ANAO-SY3R2 TaxID=3166644 RepID=UPI00366D616E
MAFSKTGLLAASLVALMTAAGCNSTRLASMDTQPAPLPAAPAGVVTSGQLPPPSAPGASQFPAAPQQTQVASLPADGGAAAANAPDLTAGNVAGVWSASVSGQSCKVATPQTRFGQGFRAGPLRCPAPVDGVKSWNVAGKQLTLYDEGGSPLARLYSSGEGRFDGQTSNGQPITLSR